MSILVFHRDECFAGEMGWYRGIKGGKVGIVHLNFIGAGGGTGLAGNKVLVILGKVTAGRVGW